MVIQACYQMEVSDYFDVDDMIKWGENDKADHTFSIVQMFFKKKYDPYVKPLNKNHVQFEAANVLQHVTRRQVQLDADMLDFFGASGTCKCQNYQ